MWLPCLWWFRLGAGTSWLTGPLIQHYITDTVRVREAGEQLGSGPQRKQPSPALVERMPQHTDTPPKKPCAFALGGTVTGPEHEPAASEEGGVSVMVARFVFFVVRGRASHAPLPGGVCSLCGRLCEAVRRPSAARWPARCPLLKSSVCRPVVWMKHVNATLLCHQCVYRTCWCRQREEWGSGFHHFLLISFGSHAPVTGSFQKNAFIVTLTARSLKCKEMLHSFGASI